VLLPSGKTAATLCSSCRQAGVAVPAADAFASNANAAAAMSNSDGSGACGEAACSAQQHATCQPRRAVKMVSFAYTPCSCCLMRDVIAYSAISRRLNREPSNARPGAVAQNRYVNAENMCQNIDGVIRFANIRQVYAKGVLLHTAKT